MTTRRWCDATGRIEARAIAEWGLSFDVNHRDRREKIPMSCLGALGVLLRNTKFNAETAEPAEKNLLKLCDLCVLCVQTS